jgi:CRISPR/Cas system-associated exonuclease Cas4 (RecB family)
MYIQEKLVSAFSSLTFEEERHLYFWEGQRVRKSVSGLVEEHVPEFDEAKWLPICAKKEKITEHELKHRWQTTNKEACVLGTETHNFLEFYDGTKTPSTPQERAGVKFLLDILKEYTIIAKEVRMYSLNYKFAGTADLLLKHRETGEIVLADYKTNKDIFKTFGLMLPPFRYLENHPFNHYQLQLSYYQIMLEDIGIQISKRLIVYLKADETYRVFETVDFTTYLRDYLTSKNPVHVSTW